jgi:hypothetical protein
MIEAWRARSAQYESYLRAEIPASISAHDNLYAASARDPMAHYLGVGRSAIEILVRAMALAGKPHANTILDAAWNEHQDVLVLQRRTLAGGPPIVFGVMAGRGRHAVVTPFTRGGWFDHSAPWLTLDDCPILRAAVRSLFLFGSQDCGRRAKHPNS